MQQVVASISMSLDGFVAGPNVSPENGLGEGGERLHDWIFQGDTHHTRGGTEYATSRQDAELLEEAFQRTGAIVMGRRMFDGAVELWGDNPPFEVPVFVVTHRPNQTITRQGGTSYIFVTGGIEEAVARAKEAAGDRDVSVAGGASIIQQLLRATLLDELHIQLVPVLLGGGTRLFDEGDIPPIRFDRFRVVASPSVTHLGFRLLPTPAPDEAGPNFPDGPQ